MVVALLVNCGVVLLITLVAFVGVIYTIRRAFFGQKHDASKCTVAFFHPYCNAGGGGERVLWCAIAALAGARDVRSLKVVVYCGDDPSKTSVDSALEDAKRRFGITIPAELDVEFVFVKRRHLLEPQRYKRFTMLGQSLGSMLLAWECLRSCNPDIFIDTTGYAFTFVVAKLLAGCLVACYVHYPTITTDMLAAVQERRPSYNNAEAVSGSVTATRAKLAYYRLFAAAYRFAGGFADAIMVNSTWTKNHLVGLWRLPGYRDPSSAVISKRGQGLAPAAEASSVVSRPGESKRGGQPTPSPRVSYGQEQEDESPEKQGSGSHHGDEGDASPGGSSLATSSASSSANSFDGLDYGAMGGLAGASDYYKPVTGILASLVRAAGVNPTLVPFPSLLLSGAGSVSGGGSSGDSGGLLFLGGSDDDPVVQASRPLASPSRRALLAAADSSLSARALFERPAARVVYPPCNTDALASMPLGWAVTNSKPASSRQTADKEKEKSVSTPVRPHIITGNSPPEVGSSAVAVASSSAAGPQRNYSTTRQRVVVSVAQFRPEKDHALQIRAFAEFLKRDPASFGDVKLVLIGGVRDDGDRERLAALKALAEAEELGLPSGSVEFRTNIPLSELRKALGTAVAGLHTMWNEHFGIGVVEMMAAGVATVAHNSGGPKSDIIVPYCGTRTGFLAATPLQYADALETIFRPISSSKRSSKDSSEEGKPARSSPPFDPVAMVTAARASVTTRFSDEEFSLCFFAIMAPVLQDGLEAAAKRRAALGIDHLGSSGSIAAGSPSAGSLGAGRRSVHGSSSKVD